MNRTRWLLAVIVVLTVANLGYRWWRGRGLITIHCENWPASRVVREIEKQGGVTVKTDVSPETPIRMHVDKVPVADAMETLAVIVEGRWRLAYVFAPTQPDIQAALAGFAAGQRPEGWKQIFYPVPPMGDEADKGAPPDPRADAWAVKAAEKPDFQAYAEQAARSVSAAFSFPETWNPPVSEPPSSATIHKAAPALAKAAGGKVAEVFLLEKRGGGFAALRREGDGERDPELARHAFEERARAEIDKLPPEKRAAAQQQFEEQRNFVQSLRDTTPEQRREKIQEYLSRDDVQSRFESRFNEQMARMTPDQRVQKAQRYIQFKQGAKGGD